MIRRVSQHLARTNDNELLTVVTIFEEGCKKEQVKKSNEYCKTHEVLVFNKYSNAYEIKNA
ncbi:MAG: hypothetical protein Q8935_10080 [Bacillota bacterium]|nr:hypothetical protein [Bacillota bacterium]